MPPRRKTRNNSARPTKAANAAAAVAAAAAATIASVAASAAIDAVAIDGAAPDAKHSTPAEAADAEQAKPAVGTKRKQQSAAAVADAGPSKVAKVVRESEVQKTTRSQRSQRAQGARPDVKEVKEVLKIQTEEMVVDGQATVDVEQVKEVTEVLHAQQANHSNERGNVKEANGPVVGKVGKAPKAEKKGKKLDQVKQSSKPKVQKEKEERPTTKRRSHPKPIYEEVWNDVYLAGTEWDQLKMVHAIDWEFDHLDDLLTEGKYDHKKIYLFGATEPQLLMRDEKDQKGQVIPIPVIVAVVTDVAPPSTVGIKSVQRSEEEIVPMSEMRMGWHAYAPENVALSVRFKPNVYVLKCIERRARLKNMSETATHRYDYVLPYFIKPDQVDDPDVSTNVQVLVELEGRDVPLMCEFDYEMDDFNEFVEEAMQENELDPEKHTEPLKKAIRDAVKATKLKYKADRDERQKRIDAIPVEDREAMKNMKLIKFYPENEWPDVSKAKSTFINRYYGHANEVL